LKKYKIK